jgi:LAO/AO transport system kinase
MSRPRPAPPARDVAATPLDEELDRLLAGAVRLQKHPLARLISLVEQERDEVRPRKAALFRHLAAHPESYPRRAGVVGVTGTPGSGKSSLIGRLALELLNGDPQVRVAVLAIDPSSAISGGALLGDRLRTHFPVGEKRIFFRSQATQGDLGGVGRRTFAVTRLLRHLFDLVFIETVGIGQSEVEVTQLADVTALVMQPLAGDHVQFLKAGVMDIPDLFVVNKCDEDRLARKSAHELRSALAYAKLIPTAGGPADHRIFLTSAVTGRGVPELAAYLRETARPEDAATQRRHEQHFLRKAVAERYGRFGLEEVDRLAAAPDAVYEEREAAVLDAIRARVR